MKYPKLCVLFDIHHSKEPVQSIFKLLMQGTTGLCDVVCSVHREPELQGIDGRRVNLGDDEIFRAFPHNKGRTLIPGNWDLKLLATVKKLPEYDYFIRYEYDVLPVGDAHAAFDRLCGTAVTVDFAGSLLGQRDPRSNWAWYDTVIAPKDYPIEREAFSPMVWHSFIPLATYSRKFLTLYELHLRSGWVGHAEALFPTIAWKEELKMADLTSMGFTNKSSFGVNEPSNADGAVFIHPVKSAEAFAKFRPL